MNTETLFHYVDHTALKPYVDWEEIKTLCWEALEFQMASVCIPSCYIKRVHEMFPKLNICTVVGFPLGYSQTEGKIAETIQAIEDGAMEIDMVVNICDIKNGDWKKVEEEIAALKKAAGDHILKVIIETCYLAKEEKIAACKAVTDAGADYIKTSTGFGTAGASLEDVRLMKEYIGKRVRIKAAGGIRNREEMEAYIAEGCSRIGTSSAIAILRPDHIKRNPQGIDAL